MDDSKSESTALSYFCEIYNQENIVKNKRNQVDWSKNNDFNSFQKSRVIELSLWNLYKM